MSLLALPFPFQFSDWDRSWSELTPDIAYQVTPYTQCLHASVFRKSFGGRPKEDIKDKGKSLSLTDNRILCLIGQYFSITIESCNFWLKTEYLEIMNNFSVNYIECWNLFWSRHLELWRSRTLITWQRFEEESGNLHISSNRNTEANFWPKDQPPP